MPRVAGTSFLPGCSFPVTPARYKTLATDAALVIDAMDLLY
jgi:hypothetical protein